MVYFIFKCYDFYFELLKSDFQNSYQVLFNSNDVQLELEDDVRLELFLDNLKLHKHYVETSESRPELSCNKYLKKIVKILLEWEFKLFNLSSPDSSMYKF